MLYLILKFFISFFLSLFMSTSTPNQKQNQPPTSRDKGLSRKTFSPKKLTIENCGEITIDSTGKIGTDADFKSVKLYQDELKIVGNIKKPQSKNVAFGNNSINIAGSVMNFSGFPSTKGTGANSLVSVSVEEEEKVGKEEYFLDKETICYIHVSCGILRIDESFLCKDELKVKAVGKGSVTLPKSERYGVLDINTKDFGEIDLNYSHCKEIRACNEGCGEIDLFKTVSEKAYLTLHHSGSINDVIISSYGDINLHGSGKIRVNKRNDDVVINSCNQGSGIIKVRTEK